MAKAGSAKVGSAKAGLEEAGSAKARLAKAGLAKVGAVLLLISTSFLIAVPQQVPNASKSPAHPPIATRRKVAGISDFAEVSPQLYRGAQPGRAGIESLQKMGIGIVVDMRGGRNKSEKAAVQKAGMQYVSISWHCPFPSDKPFAKFLELIEENPDKKIFVHCRLGNDRTGMAVAAYRMAEQGWSADDAMNEMQTFGFSAVHHVICPGLAGYEKSFPHRLQTGNSFRDLRAHGESALSK
jgi:tyrosine-protein phosphatase SIW14